MKRRPLKLKRRLTATQQAKRAERIAERAKTPRQPRVPLTLMPPAKAREVKVDLPRKQKCPVCFVSIAMLDFPNEREWRCRGCGSHGLLWLTGKKYPELLVTGASSEFDFFNKRGLRARIVAQLRKDWRKIERERDEAAA